MYNTVDKAEALKMQI